MVTYKCNNCGKSQNESEAHKFCKACWGKMDFLEKNFGIKPSQKKIGNPLGGAKVSGKLVIGIIAIFFITMLALNTIAIVPAGHTGVVFNWAAGVKPIPLYPGFHFIIPFVETVTYMETRTQLTEQEASAVSKDLQLVTTSVALNYRPLDEATPTLFAEVGTAYADRIIQPAIQESVKAVTAKYTAEQLIIQRPQVKDDMKNMLIVRLNARDIMVDDISITNFKFSEQFDAAIEAKVTAEQQALKAERDLDRIIIEKQQTITQAEAEAESTKRRAEASAYKRTVEAEAEAYALKVVREQLEKSNQLIEYKAIEQWDGILPKFASGAVPFIDIEKYE